MRSLGAGGGLKIIFLVYGQNAHDFLHLYRATLQSLISPPLTIFLLPGVAA